MADKIEPRDDNLRLIFSEEHQVWLDTRIAKTRRAIAALLAILGLGLLALSGAIYLTASAQSVFTLVSAAVTFIAAAELIRRIYDLRKYRRYTEDHRKGGS